MKAAIVYDRVNTWGGAEKVLLVLHEIFPNAPLYTSVYDEKRAPWARVFPQVIPSFLQKIPILKNYHELLGWLTPIAYESFNFDGYDLVVSVTSEAAKGIITKPTTLHICYCLTPTRYLWSGYEEYLNNPPKYLKWIPLYKYVSQPFLRYAKYWDKIAAQRPDIIIAISTEVRNRIKKYYERNSEVIYPPGDTKKYEIRDKRYEKMKPSYNLLPTSYYLIVSRLIPYKKVDLAIDACNELGETLVIVGIGSEENKLKSMYKFEKNILFMGFVPDEELVDLYKGAKAFIHPQEEDFGITSVEAQAAGTPVIAFKKGGALDTVIDGKTGIFFESQTKESLINAIKRFDKLKFNKDDLIQNAKEFTKERFKNEFLDLLNRKV